MGAANVPYLTLAAPLHGGTSVAKKEAEMADVQGPSRGRLVGTALVFGLLVLAFAQPADAGKTSSRGLVTHRNGSIAFVTDQRIGVAGSEPVWSPAGDWIAFFSGYSTLELIHPDGSGRTVVATNAYSDASVLPVTWSHDGVWLSFGAVPADTNVLQTNVVRPDGSG